MYIFVFNTLFLIGIGYCVVGCVAYPYSNSYFNNSQKKQTNQRFGLEFIKCTERVCRVLQDMLETQGTKNTSALLLAPMDQDANGTFADQKLQESYKLQEDPNNLAVQLNQREIYTRVSSNIELIGLYLQINRGIIEEGRSRPSRLFQQVTRSLQEVKETLERIEVRLAFSHVWFPTGKFVSFWAFYNKLNEVQD